MERSAGRTDDSQAEAPEDRAEAEEPSRQAEEPAGEDGKPSGQDGKPSGQDDAPSDEDGEKARFPWEEEPEGDDEPGVVKRNLDELREEAAEDARNLHGGRAISVFGTPLPLRLIGAISVFVGAFVVVYLLTWAALGDIGLAVGFILAAIVGVIAVKLFASLGSGSTSSTG